MKKFSEFKPIKKVNEANLPSNYEDMSKEELIKLMSGQSKSEENEGEPEESNDESNSEKPEVIEDGNVSKFISKLLESREMAQVYHWTVKGDMGSHAAHLALEAYYDGVIGFIDDIVEIYQGQYGLIEGYDVIDTTDAKSKDKLDYFKETVELVKSARKCIKAEDTHIHNIIDELIALQYKTIYKLTYNK
jgi:DNA-binding ferritin-like protein